MSVKVSEVQDCYVQSEVSGKNLQPIISAKISANKMPAASEQKLFSKALESSRDGLGRN